MVEKRVKLQRQHRLNFSNDGSAVPANEPTPQPDVVDLPGLKGTLPFPLAATMTREKEIPEEARMEEERFRNEPIVTPEKMKRKAITPQKPINIDDLPEEKRQEVINSVKAALHSTPASEAFIARGPGIADARQKALKAAAESEAKIKAAQAKREKPVIVPAKQEAPVKEAEPEPTPTPEPDQKLEATVCVHCGWSVGNKDGCEPTKVDKQVFVASILGQKRFMKEYSLFDGQMKVGFRTLTVDENDLVIKQLIADWNNGKISGPAHSVTEATNYQLALALSSVETNVGQITLPLLEEYDYDEPDTGTILPDIVEHVKKNAMSHEPLRRVVRKAYAHFVETQSKLEAMAESPDFWKATED